MVTGRQHTGCPSSGETFDLPYLIPTNVFDNPHSYRNASECPQGHVQRDQEGTDKERLRSFDGEIVRNASKMVDSLHLNGIFHHDVRARGGQSRFRQ